MERGLYQDGIWSDADMYCCRNLYFVFCDTKSKTRVEERVFYLIEKLVDAYLSDFVKKIKQENRYVRSGAYHLGTVFGAAGTSIEISDLPRDTDCYSFAVTLLEKLAAIDSVDSYIDSGLVILDLYNRYEDFDFVTEIKRANLLINDYLTFVKAEGKCNPYQIEDPGQVFRANVPFR